MASKTVNVGSNGYGQLEIIVTQVSQSVSGNSSKVRVRGVMHNNGNTLSWNHNGNVSRYISGSAKWPSSGTSTMSFDVPAFGTYTFVDQTFTIKHGSDGKKTVTFKVGYGTTGTGTFGNGESVSVSLTLDQIPRKPGKPGKPSLTFTAPNKIAVSFSSASANGSAITDYQVQYATSTAFGSPLSSTANNTSRTITVPTIGKNWSFRARAENAQGWGPWSDISTKAVPDKPGKPKVPTLKYKAPTTITATWVKPDDGGAAGTGYDVQYADNLNYTNAVTKSVTTLSITVTDAFIGKKNYFRVRMKNSQGNGPWSDSASYLVTSGFLVRYNGELKHTILYVKYNGEWKVALPYIKYNGEWKSGGG